MSLVSPPEGVLLQYLELLEILSHSPTLIVSQCQSILLEESVDSRYTVVPTVLEVIKSQSSVLGLGFSSLQSILRPHSLGVLELTLPGVDVPVQIGDQLVFFVAHTRSVMRDSSVSLLGEPQVTLGNQYVTHR